MHIWGNISANRYRHPAPIKLSSFWITTMCDKLVYHPGAYPCTGICVGTGNQHVCNYKDEIRDCSAALGMPAGSFLGNTTCNSNCSGYDSSQCTPNVCTSVNPNFPYNCYWYQVPEAEDQYLSPGATCMVKMNIDSNRNVICDDNVANYNAQWFQGSIVKDPHYGEGSNKVKICAVTGCTSTVNPNKCRYYNGIWSGNCFVHKTW